MSTQVIVLNGGSSSGKTSIARCLHAVLPRPWLVLGVDQLIDAMPPSLTDASGEGLTFGDQGEVALGEAFRDLERAWTAGIAAMARAGAPVIIDDVFLGGRASQERTRTQLAQMRVLWVGVHCDPETATARELARDDRTAGMAASQATLVHRGVLYDIEVDTTSTSSLECARVIAGKVDA